MKLRMKTVLLGLVTAVLLAACDPVVLDKANTARSQPRTKAEISFVTSLLSELQARSISERREYCGFIGLTPNGELVASRAVRGQEAGCRTEEPRIDMQIVASYHTHSNYSPEYDSEVPSLIDLRADIRQGIDGYIATPGGRVWVNDALKQRSVQLCGEGCIISDPNYKPDANFPVAQSYTLLTLKARGSSF